MSAALALEDWQSQVAGLSYRNQAFIDGAYADAVSGATFDCVNPANGEAITNVATLANRVTVILFGSKWCLSKICPGVAGRRLRVIIGDSPRNSGRMHRRRRTGT